MAKQLKDFLESYEFNRAALARQRLANVRGSGKKIRGARIANLMRAARMEEAELDEEDLDQLDEVLNKDASAETWIKDFVDSDAPQFQGKSKKERIKMALGAYYGKQNEEVEKIDEKSEQARRNKTMKNSMDASRGAQYNRTSGLNIQPGDTGHQTKQQMNKALGRALRNEELDEARYGRSSSYQRDYDSSRTGFGRREREDDEYHVPDPYIPPARPAPSKPPAKPEEKKKTTNEATDTVVKDKNGKLISFKHEGDWKKTDPKKNPEGKVHNLAGQALQKAKQLNKEEVELDEATYAGLEKEDKPGKIKTAVVKKHENGVESETVEGWKDAKKPVKEQYDEEGNLTTMSKSFKQFMEGMIATKVAPNVTRYTGGSYGNAKGAKYGNTDYDKETLDTKDDEGSEEQKRGRGRPAGSKSGARGPRIK